jgi:hypothetical protein
MNSLSIVAFFDILGTKDLVTRGRFLDMHSLDFANPVGIMALRYPKMRFAAFSDSVVMSCDCEDANEFLTALNMLLANWFADFIFVRGGVTLGEIRWVDQPYIDKMFTAAKNFAYARVYGSALVEATQLQEKSGPGMVCFVSDTASQVLESIAPSVVLRGPTNVLAWPTMREVSRLRKTFEMLLKNRSDHVEFVRHARATQHYLMLMEKEGKVLPNDMSINETAMARSKTRNTDR